MKTHNSKSINTKNKFKETKKNSTKRRKKPLTGGASQHKAEVPQKKNPKHSGLEYSDVDI